MSEGMKRSSIWDGPCEMVREPTPEETLLMEEEYRLWREAEARMNRCSKRMFHDDVDENGCDECEYER